ncbi:MAG: hypothetical protein IJA52_00505 [Clostridia bacterium]|nr:hypothetical protein [Clostridia bacterium]
MSRTGNVVSIVCLALGIALILLAVGAIGYTVIGQNAATERNERIISSFFDTVPEISDGFIYERSDYHMPTLQLEGVDVIGIVEVPQLSAKLPVCASWDKMEASLIPSRLSGSVYDSSLVIGGADSKGQLDFFEEICVGDTVFFTDVTGDRFEYIVSSIDVIKNVPTGELIEENDDLLMFAKDAYTSKYTVLHLKLK